jgi:hypothetical protein
MLAMVFEACARGSTLPGLPIRKFLPPIPFEMPCPQATQSRQKRNSPDVEGVWFQE